MTFRDALAQGHTHNRVMLLVHNLIAGRQRTFYNALRRYLRALRRIHRQIQHAALYIDSIACIIRQIYYEAQNLFLIHAPFYICYLRRLCRCTYKQRAGQRYQHKYLSQ